MHGLGRDDRVILLTSPMTSMRICWLNGEFVAEDSAKISIFDRGVLFGDGIYEVAAVVNGRLLDADLHLVRLTRSLAAVGIAMVQSAAAWLEIMQTLATRNGIVEGLVYLQVTRGVAEREFPFPANVPPTMFAYARPKALTNDPNAVGVRAHVVPDLRWARRDIKSTSLLAQVLAKQAARAAGAFEAIMHDEGIVTEGGSSTIWIVQHGTLVTRPLSNDILAGITRDVTLQLAAALKRPVVERAFTLDEALDAEECFLTSATSLVLPITQIDDRNIGSGQPGPVTAALRDAYIARAIELTTAPVLAVSA